MDKEKELIREVSGKMDKSVSVVTNELANIRTGRASPSLLERISVDYYGTQTPLNQMAGINAPEAQLLVIQPWDKSAIEEIEKAILKSDLGLTPSNDGNVIRLAFPPLNEERRKELVRLAGKMTEEGRVAIRQIRREANESLKNYKESGDISEDDMIRDQHEIQEITDRHIEKIDEILKNKEKEIMEV